MDSHEEGTGDGIDTDLDPRIQIELEKLNSATDDINSLEVELDEANTTFRMLLNESTRRLKALSKRLGSCIEKARPYYEALEVAKQAQCDCQKAAVHFQRANEVHQAAKETVALAEQRFLSNQHDWQFDSAWQEMLNHATIKVMEAETAKTESGLEHARRAVLFSHADQKLALLQTKLSRAIVKSRPYFEEKELCQGQLAAQKQRIETLQKEVTAVKHAYARSLKSLEEISEEIHAARETARQTREPGVGAETDVIAEMDRRGKEVVPLNNNSPITPIPTTFSPIPNSPPVQHRLLPPKVTAITHLLDEYETELDRCDLQSVGSASASVSAPTSSVVSDVEDDSEVEMELERMYSKEGKVSLGSENHSNSSWERQVSETISRLGTMLNLKTNSNSVNNNSNMNVSNREQSLPNTPPNNSCSSSCCDTLQKY